MDWKGLTVKRFSVTSVRSEIQLGGWHTPTPIHVLSVLHSGSMSTPIDVLRTPSEPTVTRPAGWNDPPILSQFSQTPRTSLPGRNTSGKRLGGGGGENCPIIHHFVILHTGNELVRCVFRCSSIVLMLQLG